MHESKEHDSTTFSQAMEFSKSGNHKAAIPLFKRVITERPKSGFVCLCLARSYQATASIAWQLKVIIE